MEPDILPIISIEAGRRQRAVNPDRVAALAESMQAIGLQTPVSVWLDESEEYGQRCHLITGAHRLSAARALGWEEIPVIFVGLSAIDRDLWEIDENLCRSELTATEEAEHLARRKELWKVREQQVGQDGPPVKPHGHAQEKGFAADTAKSTGKSKRSINRATKRAHEVTAEARDLIRNTALDTGAFLDRLMKLDPGEQVEFVRRELERLKRKENDERLRREAAEREREAKEARKKTRIAVCDFLLDALTPQQWDRLVALMDAYGGKLGADDLRKWQSPMEAA